MRELGGGGCFSCAIDADNRNDRRAIGFFAQRGWVRRKTLLDFATRDGEDIDTTAALCFVSRFHRGDDPVRCGDAEVRAEQRSFEFFECRAGQFGRAGDDAFDLVSQLRVSFLQASFEFLKQIHSLNG